MGDYIDVHCKRCSKKIDEIWAEDLTLRIDVEIEACYDCGFADGQDDCERCDDAWEDGYKQGYDEGLAEGESS